MKNLQEPYMSTWNPTAPQAGDVVAEAKLNKNIKAVVKRERTYEKNRTSVYSIVFGQCSNTMKSQLESQDKWVTINEDHNLVTLLKSIKVLTRKAQPVPLYPWYNQWSRC